MSEPQATIVAELAQRTRLAVFLGESIVRRALTEIEASDPPDVESLRKALPKLRWRLEMYFTDTLWPDFDRQAFEGALASYATRQRRFGRTGEQVAKALG